MSSLMEQAVVDADKLRAAAMRNAENSILERYSSDIKGALKTILEQAPPGMPMPDPMGMMAPPAAAPPISIEDEIPLAATGGEKLCPCPDNEVQVPITINLDDLIDIADMIKDEGTPATPDMLEEPPMDPMMMGQPPMDPMLMEGELFDVSDLLAEQEIAGFSSERRAAQAREADRARRAAFSRSMPSRAALTAGTPATPAAGTGARATLGKLGLRGAGSVAGAGATIADVVGPNLPGRMGDSYKLAAPGGVFGYAIDRLTGGPSGQERSFDQFKLQNPSSPLAGLSYKEFKQAEAAANAGDQDTLVRLRQQGYANMKAPTRPDRADYDAEGRANLTTGQAVGSGLAGAGAASYGAYKTPVIARAIGSIPHPLAKVAAGVGIAAAGGALGYGAAETVQNLSDKQAYNKAVTDFDETNREFVDANLAQRRTKPQDTPAPSPGGTGSGQPAPRQDMPEVDQLMQDRVAVEEYFPDGENYESLAGFKRGTSAYLKEKNSVYMELARIELKQGDYKAIGKIRRLQAELRSIPEFTLADRKEAINIRRAGQQSQRILTRKAAQQGRRERRTAAGKLRLQPREIFKGIGSSLDESQDTQLQEGNDNMIDINEEQLESIIEELVVDMSPDTVRAGWAGLPESEKDYAEELELARRSDTEEKEKQEAIQDTVKELSEKNDRAY
jgi:hypothetical protein